MAQLVKLEKKTSNKIEQLKLILKVFCILQGKKILSDTELTVMAYYIAYGISDATRNSLISSGVRGSLQSISNVEVTLRKYRFLIEDPLRPREDVINPDLALRPDPLIMMVVKIDNR